MTIQVDIQKVRNIAESRKMRYEDVTEGLQGDGPDRLLASEEQLEALSRAMLVKPEALVKGQAGESDLDAGIKVCRQGAGFTRTVQRAGSDYYTYEHLATTNDAPELMALKVKLHCADDRKVVLNAGHGTKELVYVLEGDVRMDWLTKERHTEMLRPGDSVYLRPDIPHSFSAASGEAQIIAVNYGPW